MTPLSSGLTAVPLAPERLPVYHAHHRAKHSLLREYMHVWLPKLGYDIRR